MSSPIANPLQQTVSWLRANTRFPQSRLAPQAETLLCFAAAAAVDEAGDAQRFLIKSRDPAQTAALKAHGMRRSLVHYKCDNSAKV